MDIMYAAACNPPRRAKRPLPDDDPDDDDDDADDPPTPKRRGRRPATVSRAAREAQRKINHSLIEKARRTKINDALATLRELVPPEYKRPSESHPDDSDDDDRPRPKPKAQEFKLEILVRTVAYLQDLTDRVAHLERDQRCPRCSQPDPDPRLPSISAWLPSGDQLPTPPTSATCPPATAGFPIPPLLTLPSPSTLLPRFSGFSPRQKPSPIPDDETAASLLLRISNTSPRTDCALTPSRLLGLNAER